MAADPVLTVVLIRHAERPATGADPALSAAGRARAALVARMLSDAGVDGVYVTATKRSQQTGTPTAERAGVHVTVYDHADAPGLVAAITAAHPMGTVLVVAHSNTVGAIAAALGAPGVATLPETQFDRLYVVTRHPGRPGADLLRLRFGADTP